MIEVLALGAFLPAGAAETQLPCVPAALASVRSIPPAIEEHRKLRQALDEPMPASDAMVMIYGNGGHLSTVEYSIVLAKMTDGAWHGTMVGRSQVWIEGAPYRPMNRFEWVLDDVAQVRLEDALSRQCAAKKRRKSPAGPPVLGSVPERIDVIRSGQTPLTFYSDRDQTGIGALIHPPQRSYD